MQDVRQGACILRQRPLQPALDERLDRDAIAQRGGEDRPDKRAVSRVEFHILGMAVVVVGKAVKRGFGIDHSRQQPCRRFARRQAGNSGERLGYGGHAEGH